MKLKYINIAIVRYNKRYPLRVKRTIKRALANWVY